MQKNANYDEYRHIGERPIIFPFSCSVDLSALNQIFFKQIISAQLTGKAALPHGLGLDSASYNEIVKKLNCTEINALEIQWQKSERSIIHQRAEIQEELLGLRGEERNELVNLLANDANQEISDAMQIAIIVATACLTSFHLWSSLGLQDRAQLGSLLKYNFPALHAKNKNNMRWKRFFYRCLCEQGGDYICKAPTCEACRSYAECFA
ncbi:nitrogen fixation protein NifQ [Psychromonas sp. MME2]|uniref:nitrogen fixation protein NifQ n=1 Tax=unclassified Psychromonas TaxID=2614957 RepID=UPI00339C7459